MDQVKSEMLRTAKSGISQLRAGDPNKLLFVGQGSSGPTMPWPTPAPSRGNCWDKNSNCQLFARDGACSRAYEWMSVNCRWSCAFLAFSYERFHRTMNVCTLDCVHFRHFNC